GTVYTYTVAQRPPHPVFMAQCPLVIAVVELEEGPRLMTNIVGCEPADVAVGMPVRVAFEAIDDSEMVLPVFKPG
ncbi:MAG: OB-fold domain-containing protein, partial [Pseudomonadota bacterium]